MTGTSPNSLQETFFNQSGDAIEVTTPQGRLIHVNPAFEKITGYSAEEAIGKTAAELMRPIGADAAFYDEIFRTINAGNVWTGEMTARKKDGTLWIASTTISPLRDENGVIFQFAAFKRDITAQKKMEQDLKESQSRFQSFAEIASDWLWEKDADLRFTFVTPRLDQHDAIQQVDYIGKTILDIDPGRIHNAIWRKHLADLAAHRPFQNFCYPITMSDDRKIIVSISGKPIFDDQGTFTGYRGVGTDITKQRHVESELTRQNEQFTAATSHISQGISMFDADHRLILCNDNYAVLYGLSPQQIKPGMTFRSILEIRHKQGGFISSSVDDFVEQFNKTHKENIDKTIVQHLSDGRHIEIRYHPTPNGGWVTTHEDITSRVEGNTKLTQQNERFHAAVSNISQGLCMYDKDKRIIISNQQYASIYRFPPGAIDAGTHLSDILTLRIKNGTYFGESPEEYLEISKSRIQGPKIRHLQDGRYISVQVHVLPDGSCLTTHEDITERKQDEKKLTSQNETFDAAISNISQGICMFDADRNLIISNDRYATIYKLSPEQIKPGMNLKEVADIRIKFGCHFGDDPEAYRNILSTQVPDGTDTSRVHQLNDGRYIEISDKVIPGGGWIATHEDVTQRIQAETRISRQKERFEAAITNISQGLCFFDSEKNLIISNSHFVSIYNLDPAAIQPGMNLREILELRCEVGSFVGESLEKYQRNHFLHALSPENEVEVHTLNNGRYIEVRSHTTSDGGWLSTHEDITDRLNAASELTNQIERFDAAISNMSQGLCLFDGDKSLIVSNHNYATLYGLTPDVIRPGMTLIEILKIRADQGIFVGTDAEKYKNKRMDKVFTQGPWSDVQELNDGRFIEIRSQPMPNGGWLATHEDITKRVKAEEKITTQNERFDAAISNMSQGLCLFDGDKNLIVSNDHYADIYGISPDLIKPGMGLNNIIDLRISHGSFAGPDPEKYKNDRIVWTNTDRNNKHRHQLANGRHIEVRNRAMPNGGWLSTHEDITDRVEAEENVITQNIRFDTAVSNISQGLCMFDGDKNLIVSNNNYAEIYRLSPDLIKPGINLMKILEYRVESGTHSDIDLEKYYEANQKWTDSPKSGILSVQLLDGRHIEIRNQVMPDGGWLSTHEDITERVNVEEKTRLQNERFNAAISNISQGLGMFDGDQNLIMSNDQFAEIYQIPIDDIKPGMTLDEISSLRVANNCHVGSNPDEYYGAQSNDVPGIQKNTIIHHMKDGRYIEVRCHPMSNGAWVSTHEDISERMEGETALRLQSERFQAALSIMHQGFCIFDADDNIIISNKRYATIYGLDPEKAKPGVNLQEIMELRITHNCYIGDTSEEYRKTHERMRTHITGEPELFRLNDGRYLNIHNMKMTDGYWLSIHEDVTERKVAEKENRNHSEHLQELVDAATAELKGRANQLRQSLEAEKELNIMQRQFVSMASHEFRTPLAIIDGTAQRLQSRAQKFDPDDTERRVEKIRSAVVRMTKLMESTLTAARMEDGKITIEVGPCAISKIITIVCERQQDIATDHKITIRTENLPDTIEADSDSIEQMLTNLLSNAIKYAPDAPEIDVFARVEHDDVVISITDHGLGIHEDDLPRMFERFFRAKTSIGITGTGIGLNLVTALVELHDGILTVDSTLGKGSTFTITLPIAGPAAAKIDKNIVA